MATMTPVGPPPVPLYPSAATYPAGTVYPSTSVLYPDPSVYPSSGLYSSDLSGAVPTLVPAALSAATMRGA